jgi:hypothetical protein
MMILAGGDGHLPRFNRPKLVRLPEKTRCVAGRGLQRYQGGETRLDEFCQLIMHAEPRKHIGIVSICTR